MPVFVIIMSMLLFASGIIWGYMVIEIMSIEQVGHHD